MVKSGGSGSYSIFTAPSGFAQFVLIGMREEKNWLLAMIHLAVGEAGLIRNDELNDIFAGNVGSGDHRELFQSMRRSKAMERMSPRGMVLRTVAPYHMPSRSMSSM